MKRTLYNEIVFPIGAGQNFVKSIVLPCYNGIKSLDGQFKYNCTVSKDSSENEYFAPNFHIFNMSRHNKPFKYNTNSADQYISNGYWKYNKNLLLDISDNLNSTTLVTNVRYLENLIDSSFVPESSMALYPFFQIPLKHNISENIVFAQRYDLADRVMLSLLAFYRAHMRLGLDIFVTGHFPSIFLHSGHGIEKIIKTYGIIAKTTETARIFTELQDIKHAHEMTRRTPELKQNATNKYFKIYKDFSEQYYDDFVYYDDIFINPDDTQIRKMFGFFGPKAEDYFDDNKDDIIKKIKIYHENNVKLIQNY